MLGEVQQGMLVLVAMAFDPARYQPITFKEKVVDYEASCILFRQWRDEAIGNSLVPSTCVVTNADGSHNWRWDNA